MPQDKRTEDTRPLVNRIEVFDDTGRVFVGYFSGKGVYLSEQDQGQTLKLFVAGSKR